MQTIVVRSLKVHATTTIAFARLIQKHNGTTIVSGMSDKIDLIRECFRIINKL